ncbi:MAG: type II toxin-antitoxin system RelB/DinJ family antitoxin [Muribaculaceae bacterium]|nr:type II toxin-antitoxin system RelB/DinJ family antitoxin [Muribaculaceae bacterium]
MGQSIISVRLDDAIKKQFDNLCAEFGMSASTAFNIYVRTVVRQRKIPFEITAENDPFYSESNAKILKESIEQMEKHPERNIVKTLEELEELADG